MPGGNKAKNRKRTQPNAGQAAPAAYRDCVVTFIDILGFRNVVSRRSAEDIQQIVEQAVDASPCLREVAARIGLEPMGARGAESGQIRTGL
jgi:hypothetical protein